MIIADDCSTDGTRDILRQYEQKDERIRVVYLDKNGGAAAARNTALKHAKGRYVAFLDSDDRWKRKSFKNSLRLWQSGRALFHLRATASWSRTERRRTKRFKPLKACHMMKL
ncbi:glycosyltransferase family 2 protein [Bacillus sp. 4A_MP3]